MENRISPDDNGNATLPATAADAPITLRIAGGSLLLSGRFAQWMPLVLAEGQEGQGTAQILFDVTSNLRRTPSRVDSAWDPDLFSFEASDVKSVGKQAYRITGRMTVAGETGEAEALLQAPPAHSPFCVLVFSIDRTRWGGLWEALQARVGDSDDTSEVRPRAWLKAPDLAAA